MDYITGGITTLLPEEQPEPPKQEEQELDPATKMKINMMIPMLNTLWQPSRPYDAPTAFQMIKVITDNGAAIIDYMGSGLDYAGIADALGYKEDTRERDTLLYYLCQLQTI